MRQDHIASKAGREALSFSTNISPSPVHNHSSLTLNVAHITFNVFRFNALAAFNSRQMTLGYSVLVPNSIALIQVRNGLASRDR